MLLLLYWPKQKSTTSSVTASVWKKQLVWGSRKEKGEGTVWLREDLSDRLSWVLLFFSQGQKPIYGGCHYSQYFKSPHRSICFGLCYWHFVNAGQVVTGHLTPYFLTVCKPNYTSTDCRAHHQFINNRDICTGDLEVIERARRSFPSKHAALSIYSALYATVSMTWEEFGLWWVSLLSSSPFFHYSHFWWLLKSCYNVFLFHYIMLLPPPSIPQCKTPMPEDVNSGMTVDDHSHITPFTNPTETDAQIIVKSTQSEQRPRLLALDTGFCHCPE